MLQALIATSTPRKALRRGATAKGCTPDAATDPTSTSGTSSGSSTGSSSGNGGSSGDDSGSSATEGRGSIGGGIHGCEEQLNLAECRHFVNLTNGIEALPMLEELKLPYSFVRIQSTACEQQNLEALMAELDANLLVSLALGHCCLVYDCGSRGRDGTPRALWYGLEFIRYTLSKLWLRRPCTALLRGKNVARNFDTHIRAFRQSTLRRLQYYTKYLPPGSVIVGGDSSAAAAEGGDGSGSGGDGRGGLQALRLYGVFRPTDYDHDASHFVRLLHQHQLPPTPTPRVAPAGQLSELSTAAAGQQRSQQETTAAGHQHGAAGQEHPTFAGSTSTCTGQTEQLPQSRTGHERHQQRHGEQQTDEFLHSHTRHEQPQDQGRAGLLGVVAAGGDGRADAHENAPGQSGGVAGGDDGDGGADADQDGEVVLAKYDFRLFRRGLSPVEWAAKAEKGAAAVGSSKSGSEA